MARFPGDSQVDPRELGSDYRKLPEEIREQVRAGWHEEDAFYQRKRYPVRSMAEHAGLFLVIHVLCFGLSFVGPLGALVTGSASGLLADRLGSNELLAGPLAALFWILGLALLPGEVLTQFMLAVVSSLFLIAFLAALLAREHAVRQSGLI